MYGPFLTLITDNKIMNGGIATIAKAMSKNRYISNFSLSVWGNEITDPGVQAMARVIEKNHSLKAFSLSLKCKLENQYVMRLVNNVL
jgi:hypothetical protein